MKGKYLFCILLCALIFTGCKNKDTFVIEGDMLSLTSNTLYMLTNSDAIKIDTIQAKGGKFEYTASSDSVAPILIYMEEKSVWITVWAKNEDRIKVSGDVNCPELITVEGNEINNLLTEFKTQNNATIQERCNLVDEKKPDNALQINDLNKLLKMEAETFIRSHPSSIASLILIQDYLLDNNSKDKIESYLSLIEGEAKNDRFYKKLSAIAERRQRTAIGHSAPDFSLISNRNDTISLKTFENKHLLLTFEASWCSVCDDDYPALVKIRKMFPKKELEIVTIALDENKDDWEELARKQGVDWYQVTDVHGMASDMVSLYNLNTIPNNFLIDKKGIIFAKDISTDSIKVLLNERIKIKS
jgi:peroxiredoxin